MIFNVTRSGGGTAVADAYANIVATYPAGSACTCTKGSTVLTATGTSDMYVFRIPEAGAWVVACTNGTASKSATVSITAQGQVEAVTLGYDYALYLNGDKTNAGGFTKTASAGSSSSLTEQANSLLQHINATSNGYYVNNMWADNPVDLTDYGSIELDVTYSTVGLYYNKTGLFVVRTVPISSASASTLPSPIAIRANVSTRQTVVLDVSALTGSYYVAHRLTGTTTALGCDATIHTIICKP